MAVTRIPTEQTTRLLMTQGARESLHDYQQAGGYDPAGWAHAPDELIALIEASGLRGRGGSGFPAGRKWRSVAAEPAPRILLINAAESEPASRKDRTLLLTRPHLVLEGALLAARAIDADECVLYLHDREVKKAVEAARKELQRARAPMPRWSTVVGPARYVAGEETAAIRYVNGGPAKPTTKPPLPFQQGVVRRPTLVQNVETLANVPLIARHGAEWFRSAGSPDYPGTLLVTLNGAVRRPGVYEVPSGTELRAVLDDLGGGTPDGVQAILPGGYFAGWLAPEDLWSGVRLEPASLRAAGAGLGAAAITVVPETVCGLAQAAWLLRFFADESARQCGPCTYGTAAMADALERVAAGSPRRDDLERLQVYAEEMLPRRGACGHLDGATMAAATALRVFQLEIKSHIA
jgi:NADH:ubiquinone oxidoreductase subunit F (NADH-binding)